MLDCMLFFVIVITCVHYEIHAFLNSLLELFSHSSLFPLSGERAWQAYPFLHCLIFSVEKTPQNCYFYVRGICNITRQNWKRDDHF